MENSFRNIHSSVGVQGNIKNNGLIVFSFNSTSDAFRSLQLSRTLESASEQLDLELMLQETRFYAWGQAWGLENSRNEKKPFHDLPKVNDLALKLINAIKAALDSLLEISRQHSLLDDATSSPANSIPLTSEWTIEETTAFQAAIRHVEILINGLYELLPVDLLLYAKRTAGIRIVATNDIENLNRIRVSDKAEPENAFMARLRAFNLEEIGDEKQANSLPWNEENLHAKVKLARRDYAFETKSLGFYKSSNPPERDKMYSIDKTTNGKPVLIEWKSYKERRTNLERMVLEHRMQKLVQLLYRTANSKLPDELLTLNCLGYFDNSFNERFGIVFDLESCSGEPITLEQYIKRKGDIQLPSLEDRLGIGKVLIRCFMCLRATRWVHKSVRSSNILLLFKETQTPQGEESKFIVRLIGFQFAREEFLRENDLESFNVTSESDRMYQNPAYLESRIYEPLYDLYGLGILLMELGYWRMLESFWPPKLDKPTPIKFQKFLISQCKKGLGFMAGTAYQNIVISCLQGDFNLPESGTEANAFLDALRETLETGEEQGNHSSVPAYDPKGFDYEQLSIWKILGQLEFCRL
ncbi:hypothetical protein TWF694_003772 [Orbilia ellipsospora]|uniref:Protein kinase domain-containing protein n=1 Tax=Orbilia ellipsospora TaxID=2528407 RepID=A0AAV9WZ47_9PEZI